jgi:hypothetical protein
MRLNAIGIISFHAPTACYFHLPVLHDFIAAHGYDPRIALTEAQPFIRLSLN